MVPRETVSFVFPRVLMFPIRTLEKTKLADSLGTIHYVYNVTFRVQSVTSFISELSKRLQ